MGSTIDESLMVGRPESPSTILRFEDKTDKNAPRLNYAIPLPGIYEGRFYIETEFKNVPWTNNAYGGTRNIEKISNIIMKMPPVLTTGYIKFDKIKPDLGVKTENLDKNIQNNQIQLEHENELVYKILEFNDPRFVNLNNIHDPKKYFEKESTTTCVNSLKIENHDISIAEIKEMANKSYVPVIYRTWGGDIKHTFVPEGKDINTANPRFVIIEHYRLSSHFGEYGAGKTIKTFTLWPGEETKLYIRSWRRTEKRFKQASTIFDSFTSEAANDFEYNLEMENGYRESYQESKNWKAKGGFGLNLGIAKIGGGGGGGGTSKTARESFAKNVSKVAMHQSSKASAQRDTTVETEMEVSAEEEYETIKERLIRNVNLSRVLNLVCRELNQEFILYTSLVDITVAFVNNQHIYEEVPLYDIDRLLNKYVKKTWAGGPSEVPSLIPHKFFKNFVLKEIGIVYDYKGDAKQFIEEADLPSGGKYLRVRHRTNPDEPNPFYPNNQVPVDGVVLTATKHTIRTDGVIIDALLGHGVALDNYALGTQQEVLREKQLSNKKTEIALKLVESGDSKKIDLFKSLFVCYSDEDIDKILSVLSNTNKQSDTDNQP